jgi:hypothetical protein
LPEPSHILPAWGIRADMRQLSVLVRNLSVMIGAVARLQERSPGYRHGKPPVLMS